MAEYYLISQLPSLDGLGEHSPIPITYERFGELCDRFLNKKACRELSSITITPPIESVRSSSSLINAWNEGERDLRLVLAKARADKMHKSFDLPKKVFPLELFKVAAAAVEAENPLEAEQYLLQHRLSFLETLRPGDHFSEEYIFYYALKLKLILRIRQFDTASGVDTYKNIYSSILNGAHLEA